MFVPWRVVKVQINLSSWKIYVSPIQHEICVITLSHGWGGVFHSPHLSEMPALSLNLAKFMSISCFIKSKNLKLNVPHG